RNCDPGSGVRAWSKSDNDGLRFSKSVLHFSQIFEERAGILSIVWPLLIEFNFVSSAQRDAAARAGKFEREDFHLVSIARSVSDFVSNEIQRAFSGIRLGKRSAHSMTETPSPKKYSSNPSRSAPCRSSIRKKSK